MRLARHLALVRDDADGVHVILGWIADGGYFCWFVVALLLLMWLGGVSGTIQDEGWMDGRLI